MRTLPFIRGLLLNHRINVRHMNARSAKPEKRTTFSHVDAYVDVHAKSNSQQRRYGSRRCSRLKERCRKIKIPG
ncbi:uncharacterized protein FOMMEDRAFT_142564 [Fomitiporia mediterranea MF3/22]|uniref:uncharacterized protein n=1 Tax=Fomitiporia mediterranea (strain MF3/22) TaxID=694068 RepID=UPI0004408A96|nr:uncharacterized protein FOMMEDRAFT_142564 [Fomitiporia mediterranea MF3/22]EJD00163.1 hypothetical protein FOMMEDRAFT_142564 [Fomitiporia mediterranea MF3/22]